MRIFDIYGIILSIILFPMNASSAELRLQFKSNSDLTATIDDTTEIYIKNNKNIECTGSACNSDIFINKTYIDAVLLPDEFTMSYGRKSGLFEGSIHANGRDFSSLVAFQYCNKSDIHCKCSDDNDVINEISRRAGLANIEIKNVIKRTKDMSCIHLYTLVQWN